MVFTQKSQNKRLMLAALTAGAAALSACSSVNPDSKMSTQSVFGNTVSGYTSVPGMTFAPKAYNCGTGMSCGVMSANECPITRQPRTIRQVACYDGTVVSDVSQCGPIVLPTQTYVQAAPQPYVQPYVQPVQADVCANGYRQETVYYDFNRSASTDTRDAARRVLSYGQQCDINSVQIIGHADTSGPMNYNEGLSQRRARDVKSELVRQGLDGGRISTSGMGERQNAIEHGDGVREPLNRRTDIQIQTQSRGYGY